MAQQLLVDLYGCDPALLDDPAKVSAAAQSVVRSIGAEVVDELVHKFEPVGVTYVAIITTSHVSIHTWPELRYAALDVFSCSDGVPAAIAQAVGSAFGATSSCVKSVTREIGGGNYEV